MSSLLYSGPLPFILASRSPRRQELLRRLGVDFSVRPADIDEGGPADLPPRELAIAAAARKAAAVAREIERGIVLGADTIVVLDGEVLGKPTDAASAIAMLKRLVGQTHQVTTGLALIDVERGSRAASWEDTLVHMRRATESEIAAYVDTGEPLDKAGAYGIQEHGALLVDRIEGCYFNVVGLPLVRLQSMLREIVGDGARRPGRGDG